MGVGNYGGVSCAGTRFTVSNDLLEEIEEGAREVTRRLKETSKRNGVEISTEKSKVMVARKKEPASGSDSGWNKVGPG